MIQITVRPNAVKLTFIPRALFTVCLAASFWVVFWLSTPALAADFGSHKGAADSYRKSLPQLRSSKALIRDAPPTIENKNESKKPFSPNAEPKYAEQKQSKESSVSNRATKQVIEQPEEPTVSNKSFFTDTFSNRFSYGLSHERRSPYAVIAAARRTNSSFQHSLVLPRFTKQLPQQLTQLRTSLRAQPIRFIRVVKAAFSNALDRMSTSAHQTAERLRQP